MKLRFKVILASLGAGLIAAGTAFQFSRHNYEEPEYSLVESSGELELRRYEPRVVAETVVYAEDESGATSEGFRRLAGYIFGGNAKTVEVERRSESVRIDMTTPVESVAEGDGWVIRFTMPREQTLETLPTPEDPRVTLRRLEPEMVAVVRFSGRAGIDDLKRRAQTLRASVAAEGLEVAGEPTLAQFDPPWVVGLLRRNEIHVPVRGAVENGG